MWIKIMKSKLFEIAHQETSLLLHEHFESSTSSTDCASYALIPLNFPGFVSEGAYYFIIGPEGLNRYRHAFHCLFTSATLEAWLGP